MKKKKNRILTAFEDTTMLMLTKKVIPILFQ